MPTGWDKNGLCKLAQFLQCYGLTPDDFKDAEVEVNMDYRENKIIMGFRKKNTYSFDTGGSLTGGIRLFDSLDKW